MKVRSQKNAKGKQVGEESWGKGKKERAREEMKRKLQGKDDP